jgi:tetratricopeptide (TPR) repeat protein
MIKIPAGLNLQPGEEKNLWQEISDRPDRLSLYRKLARLLERRNRPREAVMVLKRALKKVPAQRPREALDIKKQIVRLYEADGDDRAAVRAYRKLIREYPREWVPYERLERVYARQDRKSEMVKIYRAVKKGNPQRERVLKRLVRLETDLGNFPSARSDLRKLLKEFGPDYMRLKDLGRLYEKTGNLKSAVAAYKKALKLKPRNPDLELMIGVSKRKTGQRKQARDAFREILNHTPGWYGSHIHLAEMDIEDGRFGSAEEHMKAIDRRFPGNSRVAINRARILLAEGQPQEALDLAGPAAVQTPFYYTDELSLGHQVQADAHAALDREEEAEYHSLMARRLKGSGDYFSTTIETADELIESGNLDLAEKVADGLLERYPVNSLARIKKAEIARMRGDLDQALSLAAEAAKEDNPRYRKDKIRALELLAELHGEKGEKEKAEKCRRRAEELSARPPDK